MTLLPASDFGIRGHVGVIYELGERCAAPACTHRSVHRHHLWPRSYLRGQPYEWVRLPDGTVIGNSVGLCITHHNAVTGAIGGHLARVLFRQGLFFWEERASRLADVWERVGPLLPQPPGVKVDDPKTVDRGSSDEVCPTCGHHKRKSTPSPARKAKSWAVDVPDDGELGADNLDEFVLWIAEALGFDDERSRLRRYHALVHVLIWVIQQREEFIADLKEAAEA